MDTAHSEVYRLENSFGLSLSVEPDLGHYDVRYGGQSWLGRGIVSLLRGGRWYRSQKALSVASREDHRLIALRDSELYIDSVHTGVDSDVLGSYDFIELSWRLEGTEIELTTGFRLYRDQPYLVFVQQFPNGFRDYASGNWAVPAVIFPQFCGGRSDLYSWASVGMFEHKLGYGKATSIAGNVDLLLLNDSRNDTAILSPFGNYLAATQQSAAFGGRHHQFSQGIHCGIQGLAEEIPPGFTHAHILVVGKGVDQTFQSWGRALLTRSGKQAPSKYADDTIKYLTYWDDYGAYYCQHGFVEEGYASYEEVLLAVEAEATRNGLNIGAYQVLDLDQLRQREGLFEPRDDLFPHGIAWLREKLGKPIQAYVAWLPAKSPYRERYPFYECESWGLVPIAGMGDVFYTDDYWRFTADKLVSWGCISLQHDFLSVYEGEKAMMSGIDNMGRFFKAMAAALDERGITMHYCMQLPRNIMESTENPTMLALQGTWDHHAHSTLLDHYPDEADSYCWKHLLFTNAFYGSLGIWPCRDNIQTVADPNAYEDVLLANLSGGSVQLGHRIGECDFGLLRRTFREGDGLLLKPDRPIVPLDRCYREGGAVGFTRSSLGGRAWYYVLSLPSAGYLASFCPADLGAEGTFAVYNYGGRMVAIREATTPIALMREAKHEYYVLAPILENGMAVIGDVSKFVTMADMRVTSLESHVNSVRVGVASSKQDGPIIVGYSCRRPLGVEADGMALEEVSSLSRLNLAASGWCWDYSSKLWYVRLSFASASAIETRFFSIHGEAQERA